MKLTSEEGCMAVYGDNEDWTMLPETKELVEQSRWSIVYTAVFLHKPSGKHYRLDWSVGATEQQDEEPFEHSVPDPQQVIQVPVDKMEWMPVEEVGDGTGD